MHSPCADHAGFCAFLQQSPKRPRASGAIWKSAGCGAAFRDFPARGVSVPAYSPILKCRRADSAAPLPIAGPMPLGGKGLSPIPGR